MKVLRRTYLLFVTTFLLGNILAYGQIMPPEIKCVEKNNQDIIITWQVPANFCGPFAAYYLFADTNIGGSFPLLDSIINPSQTSYKHVGAVPLAPVWYYYMKANFICPSFTQLPSQIINSNPPAIPNIIGVTVININTHDVQVDWEPSASPESYGYVVYWDQNANGLAWVNVGTTIGKYNTTFFHKGSRSHRRSESYRVAAMDSCGNIGVINELPHNTIYLETILDRCSQKVVLKWNRYNNWIGGVSKYKIYAGSYGTTPILVAEVGSGIRRYDYTNIIDGDTLCFFIEAINGDSTVFSKSNVVCLEVETIKPPSLTYLYNASVVGTNHVRINWFVEIENVEDLDFFKIQRRAAGNNFETLKVDTSPGNPFLNLFYDDYTPITNAYSYDYRVVSVDVCGDESFSNIGKTIFLSVESEHDFINKLNWTEYNDWMADVNLYYIERSTDGERDKNYNFVEGTTSTYDDDVVNAIDRDGTFCYRIRAVENFNHLLITRGIDKASESTSNEVCVTQYPNIYVPTAFAPRGQNRIFKPLLLFVEGSNYTFRVFNRWGNMVYRTNNPDEGWDGIFNGEYSPQGVYVYDIEFTNPNGSAYSKSGTVFLMRTK